MQIFSKHILGRFIRQILGDSKAIQTIKQIASLSIVWIAFDVST